MTVLEEEEDRSKEVLEVCMSKKCAALSGYFRESALRMDLERQNEKLREQNVLYRKAISTLLSSIRELLHPYCPAINFLRERLKDVPKVTQVFYFITDNVVNLWIITEEEDFETEMKIVENLRELFSIFRNLLFDFMIIPKGETPLEELIPQNAERVFSRV